MLFRSHGALGNSPAPVVAVAPIIGGRAVKGPTAKIMSELGLKVDAAAVARHYGKILDGYVVDHGDVGQVTLPGLHIHAAAILMASLADREALAREVVAFADRLRALGKPVQASA